MTVDAEASTATTTTTPPRPPRSRRKGIARGRILGCLVVIVIYALAAIFGPMIMGYDPVATSTGDRLLPPGSTLSDGSAAVLGTDQVGQDVLAQMMMGARISMSVGIATLILAGVIGIVAGLLAGFYGGWLDSLLMRLADIQLTFPSILLAIFIASVLGPSVVNVVIVLAISNWVTFARVARSQVLTLRSREYVDAARTLGAGNLHLILRTILPGCVAPMLVVATVELGHVILAEASLSFLGLGVPANVPSWGMTIANGRDYLGDAWWISTFPGIGLALLVLTCGVLGDALRDRFDPKPEDAVMTDTLTLSRAGAPTVPSLLEVDGLRVEFDTSSGPVRALDGVSFRVGVGETVALLGESGSGKSVTAQAIMALLPKDTGRIAGGSILFDGADLAAMPVKTVRRLCGTEIAMIFQDPLSSLNPVFRVGAQIAEPLRRRRGVAKKEAMRQALELMNRVGIPDAEHRIGDYPFQFSGGQRQRLMIAMSLALDPRLVIADEPTTALDVTVQAQIMHLLADLQAETGMAMLLITHDLGVVADVADRAYILYAGRMAESGSIRDMYDHPAHPYTKGLLESIPSAEIAGEKLHPIPGAPPSLFDLPSGCAFHPRCPYAAEQCVSQVPKMRHPDGWPVTQRASCHRTEEVLAHE